MESIYKKGNENRRLKRSREGKKNDKKNNK